VQVCLVEPAGVWNDGMEPAKVLDDRSRRRRVTDPFELLPGEVVRRSFESPPRLFIRIITDDATRPFESATFRCPTSRDAEWTLR
jgi:hypothetical protein